MCRVTTVELICEKADGEKLVSMYVSLLDGPSDGKVGAALIRLFCSASIVLHQPRILEHFRA